MRQTVPGAMVRSYKEESRRPAIIGVAQGRDRPQVRCPNRKIFAIPKLLTPTRFYPIGPHIKARQRDNTNDAHARRALTSKAAVLVTLALLTARGAAQASAFATVYNFKGEGDGASPNGVTFGKNGALYGTTFAGGSNNTFGTVFELTPVKGGAWTKTVLFDFNGADGARPSQSGIGSPGASLVFGGNGALYGTTSSGGSAPSPSLAGTVFELAPPATAGGV